MVFRNKCAKIKFNAHNCTYSIYHQRDSFLFHLFYNVTCIVEDSVTTSQTRSKNNRM